MCRILIVSLMLLFSSVFASAQQQQAAGPEKMRQEMEKMRQNTEKMQQAQLERLKQENPQLYQQRKNSIDAQAKINAIVASFREGKISSSQAESQLSPLVKQDMQTYINDLDNKIKRLEKKLDFYKKAKANPSLLIKKRVDELLGKSMPRPEDFMD